VRSKGQEGEGVYDELEPQQPSIDGNLPLTEKGSNPSALLEGQSFRMRKMEGKGRRETQMGKGQRARTCVPSRGEKGSLQKPERTGRRHLNLAHKDSLQTRGRKPSHNEKAGRSRSPLRRRKDRKSREVIAQKLTTKIMHTNKGGESELTG